MRRPDSTELGGRAATRRRAAVLVLAAVFVAAAAGCGATTEMSATPSSSGIAPGATASPRASTVAPSVTPLSSQQLASLYQTIEGQVVKIRELRPKSPVDPTIVDDAGIKKITADAFNRDNPPEVIAANQRMYTALGMLPPGASL